MSKIRLSVQKPTQNIHLIKLIKNITKEPLLTVRNKLAQQGSEQFFYSTQLFNNDHDERDSEIRLILRECKTHEVSLFISEIMYDEDWDTIEHKDKFEYLISDEELLGTLDSHKK